MKPLEIARAFREKVGAEIDLEAEGLNRFIVYTPFTFDDGDHYVVILKRENDQWVLSDEGNTFMRITYSEVDMASGTRAKMVDQALASSGVENMSGELRLTVPDAEFGDALFTFIQTIARIVNTSLWTHERVRSTFFEDVRQLIHTAVPMNRIVVDYNDEVADPNGDYTIHYVIHGLEPCFVFPISNDAQCQQATIKCQWWEKRKKFSSVALFEDQERINRKFLAQLSSVADRQFPSLAERDRISAFFSDVLPKLDAKATR